MFGNSLFDGTDLFIINMVRKHSFHEIQKKLEIDDVTMTERLDKFANYGIRVYPGIKVAKFEDKDLRVYELMLKGIKSRRKIAEILNIDESAVAYSKSKLRAITSNSVNDKVVQNNNDETVSKPKLSAYKIDILMQRYKIICELREQGCNNSVIAAELGISKQSLSVICRTLKDVLGLEIPKKAFRITETDKQIIQYRKDGMSLEDISELIRKTPHAIAKRLKVLDEQGFDVDKAFKPDDIDKTIIKLRSQGKELSVIAATIGISLTAISKRINKLEKNGFNVCKANTLDDTDQVIIDMLANNCSVKDIASALNLHHNTIYYRIKKMQAEGLIEGDSICTNPQNLAIAVKKFIKSKNPTPEQLDAIIQYASKTYGIDIRVVTSIANYLVINPESPVNPQDLSER